MLRLNLERYISGHRGVSFIKEVQYHLRGCFSFQVGTTTVYKRAYCILFD